MPLRCLQCEYTLDGLQPQHDAVVCPECGLRQFPGDRERGVERRLRLYVRSTMAPWAAPVGLSVFLGWLEAGWAYLLIVFTMMLAPLVSAGMALSVLVRERRPRMTASQRIGYLVMWIFGTLVGVGLCWAVLSVATLSRQ